MFKGQYYKYWYTPIIIYIFVYFVLHIFTNEINEGIAYGFGAILAILFIEVCNYIINLIIKQYEKHKYKASTPIKCLNIHVQIELPENEIANTKHFMKNDFINLIQKDENKTCRIKSIDIGDTNKAIHNIQATESED